MTIIWYLVVVAVVAAAMLDAAISADTGSTTITGLEWQVQMILALVVVIAATAVEYWRTRH